MSFHSQFSYLENFKCSSRATLMRLAGRMWPAGRMLPRPVLGYGGLIFDQSSFLLLTEQLTSKVVKSDFKIIIMFLFTQVSLNP